MPTTAAELTLLPRSEHILGTYPVWLLFDLAMLLGTAVLGACYAIARRLSHVGVFCDISDLVVHLPERVLFRLNFSLVGALLAIAAFVIRDMAHKRVGGWLPTLGCGFQVASGLGVILVGACGPEEIYGFHIFAAVLGFGGSGVAQIIYAIVFLREDEQKQLPSAKRILTVRCCISCLFLGCAVLFGLAEAQVITKEPWEHIFEWGMWFTLLGWFFTFRWDLASLAIASAETSSLDQL